jgi:hypothetical protein
MKYEKIIKCLELPRKQKKKAKKIISSHKWQVIQWAYLLKKEYGNVELNLKSINKQA